MMRGHHFFSTGVEGWKARSVGAIALAIVAIGAAGCSSSGPKSVAGTTTTISSQMKKSNPPTTATSTSNATSTSTSVSTTTTSDSEQVATDRCPPTWYFGLCPFPTPDFTAALQRYFSTWGGEGTDYNLGSVGAGITAPFDVSTKITDNPNTYDLTIRAMYSAAGVPGNYLHNVSQADQGCFPTDVPEFSGGSGPDSVTTQSTQQVRGDGSGLVCAGTQPEAGSIPPEPIVSVRFSEGDRTWWVTVVSSATTVGMDPNDPSSPISWSPQYDAATLVSAVNHWTPTQCYSEAETLEQC
jgi:hypothetical protein